MATTNLNKVPTKIEIVDVNPNTDTVLFYLNLGTGPLQPITAAECSGPMHTKLSVIEYHIKEFNKNV